jgi:hypothetical protein
MKKITLCLILFIGTSLAQDSLYLVNTLVGDTLNRLNNAKAAGDINGDGYADLAVMFEDSTYIYFGNPTFELEPDLSIYHGLSFPGDVNNDGFADFLFIKQEWIEGFKHNKIFLGYGGVDIDTSGYLLYEQQYWGESFSSQVDPLGDVNGDGYNDFVIASPYNWSDGISRVYLYLGGDTISSEPEVVFTSESGHLDFFGHAVTGIGDQNNDGYDDFLISAPNEPFVDSTISIVYLYYGGSEINSSADSILTFSDREFGFNLKNVGDINNDGSKDFAITSQAKCIVYLNFDSIMTTHFYGSGHGLGGNGDVNNDGIMDLLIGDPSYKDTTNFIGRFDTYIGKNNFSFIPDYINIGEQYGSLFSQYIDFIGDFNKDGYDDIFVVATTFREEDKEIGKLYLYSYKKYTGIETPQNQVIRKFELLQNYPNPFNNTTVIPFYITTFSEIKIDIYNIQGRIIKTIFKGKKAAGMNKVSWNGKTNNGANAASGVYFVVLKQSVNNINSQSQKIILLK